MHENTVNIDENAMMRKCFGVELESGPQRCYQHRAALALPPIEVGCMTSHDSTTEESDLPVRYAEIARFPGYRFCSDGSVWSKRKPGAISLPSVLRDDWRPMRSWPDRLGYLIITLRQNGVRARTGVHLLVLEAFKGARPAGMDGCHNNGNPSDARLSNLRWDTPKNNSADSIAHGTTARGSKNGWSKLTESQVLEIRGLAAARIRYEVIAARYGISKHNVGCIKSRRSWGWLEGTADPDVPVTLADGGRQK